MTMNTIKHMKTFTHARKAFPIVRSLPKHLADRFSQHDKRDSLETKNKKIVKLSVILPNVVKKFRDNNDVIDRLVFLDVIHTPPLSAESRLLLRESVRNIIEDNNIYGVELDELISFLESRGAL